MPRDRVNLLEDIALQPQARPTGAFLTAPQVRVGKTAALAQSLAALNQGVQPFLMGVAGGLTDEHILESKKRAEVWASKNEINRKEFVKLVRSSQIAPEENPHFHKHLSAVVGSRVATEDYLPSVMLALDEQKPDTPEKLNQLIQSRRAAVLEQLEGDTDAQAAFIQASAEGENQVRREAIHKRRADVRAAAEYQLSASVDEAIDSVISTSNVLTAAGGGVTINPVALQAVQDRIEAYAQQTGDYEGANALLMRSVLRAYNAYGEDEDILDLADKLYVGPANQKNRPTLARTFAAEVKAARERAGSAAWEQENRDWTRQERSRTTAMRSTYAKIGELTKAGKSFQETLDALPGEMQNDPQVQELLMQTIQRNKNWAKSVDKEKAELLMQASFKTYAEKTARGEALTPEDASGLLVMGAVNGWTPEQTLQHLADVKNAVKLREEFGGVDDPAARVAFRMAAEKGELDLSAVQAAAVRDRALESQLPFLLDRDAEVRRGDNRMKVSANDPQVNATLDMARAAIDAHFKLRLAALSETSERDPREAAEIAADGGIALTLMQSAAMDELDRLNTLYPKDRAKVVSELRGFINERMKSGGYKTLDEIEQAHEKHIAVEQTATETAVAALQTALDKGEPVTLEKLRTVLSERTPANATAFWKLVTNPDLRIVDTTEDSFLEVLPALKPVVSASVYAPLQTLVKARTMRLKRLGGLGEETPEEMQARKELVVQASAFTTLLESPESKQAMRRVFILAGMSPEEQQRVQPFAGAITVGESEEGASGVTKVARKWDGLLGPALPSKDTQTPADQLTQQVFPGESGLQTGGRMTTGAYLRMAVRDYRQVQTNLDVIKRVVGRTPDEVLAGVKKDGPEKFTQQWDWNSVPYFRSENEMRNRVADVTAALGLDEAAAREFTKAQLKAVYRAWSLGDGKITPTKETK